MVKLNTNDISTRNQQAIGDLNADRRQQSANIETARAADTQHFIGGKIIKGSEWAGGAARTLLGDAQSGKQTLAGRAAGSLIEIGDGAIGLGMQYRSIQNRAAGQQSAVNEAFDTRIANQESASRSLVQNQEGYLKEIVEANQQRAQGLTAAETASANQAVAGANSGAAVAKGGVNKGYRLDLQANRISYIENLFSQNHEEHLRTILEPKRWKRCQVVLLQTYDRRPGNPSKGMSSRQSKACR